jgi:hypothetical protein
MPTAYYHFVEVKKMTERKSTKNSLTEQLSQRVKSNGGLWAEFPNLATEDCKLVVLISAFTYVEV